jgi:hypothetical protein
MIAIHHDITPLAKVNYSQTYLTLPFFEHPWPIQINQTETMVRRQNQYQFVQLETPQGSLNDKRMPPKQCIGNDDPEPALDNNSITPQF